MLPIILLSLTGAEAVKQLGRYNVLDHLCEHYEALHTQSRQWIYGGYR
ncbi:MAG: DUF3791 domain-containing protein [Prevotellaceae bacterium]|nr:DUF3791 domain-containing protein [Prevotellaceae bacterium]